MEKKIHDRQIGKQGTADRVVDELNPDAHLSLKDATRLVCDDEEDPPPKDFSLDVIENVSLTDPILGCVLERWGNSLTKDPSQYDALQVEGKEMRLSEAEKQNAERLYQEAKMGGATRRQNSSTYHPKLTGPAKSKNPTDSSPRPSKIPSQAPQQDTNWLTEALAQGKLKCKEMVLTKDVTIARSAEDGETTPIVLPPGTRIKLIQTPRGIYMQTPEGNILRINSSSLSSTAGPASITAALDTKNLSLPDQIRQDLFPNTEMGKSSSAKPNLKLATLAEVGAGCSQSVSSLKPSTSKRPSTAELPTDLADFVLESESESSLDGSKSGPSGLFDNVSLAPQPEGLTADDSLKDLLETTNNAIMENVDSDLWISDLGSTSELNYPLQWSDYPQWSSELWDGASASSQVNWQWQQQMPQQVDPIFGSANSEVDMSTVAGSSHQYSSSDFENYYDFPTSSATMYPSHSLPPAGHYTPSYFVTDAPTYATYPQTSQPGQVSGLNSDEHNQFIVHGDNDFIPSHSQPYNPDSFPQ